MTLLCNNLVLPNGKKSSNVTACGPCYPLKVKDLNFLQ